LKLKSKRTGRYFIRSSAGSKHAEDPVKENIHIAIRHDPSRSMEVCLQCHMRIVDNHPDTYPIEDLYGNIKDYSAGVEPGMSLTRFKKDMSYQPWGNDAKYYGNGVGQKNRMQGNEYNLFQEV
jgi:hypothetical protein